MIDNGVRVISGPQLNPSSFLPIRLKFQTYAKFFSLPVEIYLIIESICYLFIISSNSIINLYSVYTHTVI